MALPRPGRKAVAIATGAALLVILIIAVANALAAPSWGQVLPTDELVAQYTSANDLFVMLRQPVGSSYIAVIDDKAMLYMLYADDKRVFRVEEMDVFAKERVAAARTLYISGSYWPIRELTPFVPMYVKDEAIREGSLRARAYLTNRAVVTAMVENGYCILPLEQKSDRDLPSIELIVFYDREENELYRYPEDRELPEWAAED